MRKLQEYSRYIFCIFLLIVVFAVYVLRLADWQIVQGASWLQKSDTTNSSTVKLDASRGEILDANGNGLVVNKTGYSIVFDKTYMKKGTENKTILELTKLLAKRGETWVDELPITVNTKGQYAFVSGKEKEIATMKSRDFLNLNSYATADQCMQEMIKRYDCASYSAADIRTIVSARYNMEKSYFSISNPYTFAENISQDTVSIVSENAPSLPGATIKVTTVRQYPSPTLLPHILGTVGSLSQDDYTELKSEGKTYSDTNLSGYTFNDHIGVGGIERALESSLRGKSGLKKIETTNTGALASENEITAPVNGNTVYLTIDSRLQAVANASLAKQIKLAQEYGKEQLALGNSKMGEDCVRGGVVVLNVNDFSVLAAATYPSYDMSQLDNISYYNSLLQDVNKPLVNNAFNGVFMPGSAFKPMVAAAALQEGVINRNSTVFCTGEYDRWKDYRPTCHNNYGTTNVITALQKSCNIFFYETGFNLGIQNIDLYGKRFGLGQKTGIEISESSGTIASPEERKAAGGKWLDYGADVVQTAIGQSDNAFTPLQLATYCATIANNGVRLKTHLVSKVTDYSRKTTILQTKPTIVDNVEVSQANLDIVKEGMRACAQSGTASYSYAFGSYDIAVAAKTGTAQNPPHSDNVTFIGFAPYDKPQIAVAVVLEYGAKSIRSLSVARDMFDAYFKGYTVDASGNIVAPSAVSSAASSSTASSASSASTTNH